MADGKILQRYQPYSPSTPANYPGAAPTINADALDSAAAMINLKNARQVFVDGDAGSDATGTGSLLRPYQTLPFALTQVAALPVGDYVIQLAPGTYGNAGADIIWPTQLGKNISLVGAGFNTGLTDNIVFTSVAGDNNQVLFSNLGIGGGKQFIIDLSLAAIATVLLANGGFAVNRVDTLPPGAQSVRIWNSFITSVSTSSLLIMSNCHWVGGPPNVIAASGLILMSGCLFASMTATVDGTLEFIGCITNGTNIAGTGTVATDATSVGASIMGPTTSLIDAAQNIGFTPAVPANWLTPPTQVKEALDALAAGTSGIPLQQVKFVGKNGNNATATGSIESPFLTITAALASITDNTSGKQYAVLVAPGQYIEDVAFKPNVSIAAFGLSSEASELVKVNGALSLDATWAGSPGGATNISGISFDNSGAIDNSALHGTGILKFLNCDFGNAITFTDTDCTMGLLGDGVTFNGVVTIVGFAQVNGEFNIQAGGSYTTAPGKSSIVVIKDSTIVADVFTATANNGDTLFLAFKNTQAIQAFGGGLSLVQNAGGSLTFAYTVDSFPGSFANAGATLLPFSIAQGLGYTPAVPGDWTAVPTEVKSALDELAARPTGGGGSTAIDGLYWVSANGNDGTGDGSLSKPFLTIQAAINQAVTDGHGFANRAEVLVLPAPAPYAGFTTANGVNVTGVHGDQVQVGEVVLASDASGIPTNLVVLSNLEIVANATVGIASSNGPNAAQWTLRNVKVTQNTNNEGIYLGTASDVVLLDNCEVNNMVFSVALSCSLGVVRAINGCKFTSVQYAVLSGAGCVLEADEMEAVATGGGAPAVLISGLANITNSKITNSSALAASPALEVDTGTLTIQNCQLSAAGANENFLIDAGGTMNQAILAFAGASASTSIAGAVNNLPVYGAAGAQDLSSVLATGNDAGAKKIVNLLDPTLAQDAATKAYTDSGDSAVAAAAAAAEALDVRLDGSRAMTGALDMGTHLIHNVVDPAAAQDASTKNYTDVQAAAAQAAAEGYSDAKEVLDVRLDGSRAMTGALDMGTHLIHNVVDPVAAQDAATKKYVDDSIVSNTLETNFVFQPGGVAGGNIYDNWANLIAAMVAAAGPKVVYFDDSIVSPAVIPAGAYDLSNVTLANGNPVTQATVEVSIGVTFTNFNSVESLIMNFLNTAAVETVNAARTIKLRNANINANGAAPVWDIAAAVPLVMYLEDFSKIQNGGTEAINVQAAQLVQALMFDASEIGNDALSGAIGGQFFSLLADASCSSGTQAGFAGTYAVILEASAAKVGYNPTTPADWSVAPSNAADGLDNLAATRLPLDGAKAMTGALDMGTHLINNVVDPVSAQDAATKNYVDNHNLNGKETFTIDATILLNQYIDLAQEIKANSLAVIWNAGNPPFETDDYTIATVGGVSRVSFVAGGVLNTFLLSGQKLQMSYLY